jgi:hypothetical protein
LGSKSHMRLASVNTGRLTGAKRHMRLPSVNTGRLTGATEAHEASIFTLPVSCLVYPSTLKMEVTFTGAHGVISRAASHWDTEHSLATTRPRSRGQQYVASLAVPYIWDDRLYAARPCSDLRLSVNEVPDAINSS